MFSKQIDLFINLFVQHDRGGLFRGQPQGVAVVRYHSLAAEERSLPPELAVTARASDGGAVMACTTPSHSHSHYYRRSLPVVDTVRHRSKPQFGLQFHPESILTQQGRRYLENFRDITLEHHRGRPAMAIPIPAHCPPPPSPPLHAHLRKKKKKRRYAFLRQVSPSPSPSPYRGIEPAEVFEALFSTRPAAFFLDSGAGAVREKDEAKGPGMAEGEGNTGVSYLGAADCEHSHVLEYWGRDHLLRRRAGRTEQLGRNLFQHLRELLAAEREVLSLPAEADGGPPGPGPGGPFAATFFGFLGYELGREAEALLANPRPSWDSNVNLTSPAVLRADEGEPDPPPLPLPLAVLMFPRTYIAYNHSSGAYWVASFSDIVAEEDEDEDAGAQARAQAQAQAQGTALFDRLEALLRSRRPPPPSKEEEGKEEEEEEEVEEEEGGEEGVGEAAAPPCSPARPLLTADKSRAEYLRDIRSALEHILRGDTYEVCLTAQFRGPLPPHTHAHAHPAPAEEEAGSRRAWQIYRSLQQGNPAPYACYIHYDPSLWAGGDLTWCPPDGLSICSSSPERYLRIEQVGQGSAPPSRSRSLFPYVGVCVYICV